MMLLVMALLIGGLESMRPVELGPSPAASEELAPMAKRLDSEGSAGKDFMPDGAQEAEPTAGEELKRLASFVNDPRGELLVRLWIGAARTSWETVPPEVGDNDLERCRELLNELLDAFEVNDRAIIDRLEGVLNEFRGVDKAYARLARYVEFIGHCGRIMRRPDVTRIHPSVLYAALIRWGKEFEAISLERFCEIIDRISAEPGGRGRTGARTAAAILMVEAHAFGFERCDGETFADAVGAAKDELREAEKQARKATAPKASAARRRGNRSG